MVYEIKTGLGKEKEKGRHLFCKYEAKYEGSLYNPFIIKAVFVDDNH